MGLDNPIHLIFLGAIALMVLGPKRLPEVARSLGKGIREFRESMEKVSAGGLAEDDSAPYSPPQELPLAAAGPFAAQAQTPQAMPQAPPPAMPEAPPAMSMVHPAVTSQDPPAGASTTMVHPAVTSQDPPAGASTTMVHPPVASEDPPDPVSNTMVHSAVTSRDTRETATFAPLPDERAQDLAGLPIEDVSVIEDGLTTPEE